MPIQFLQKVIVFPIDYILENKLHNTWTPIAPPPIMVAICWQLMIKLVYDSATTSVKMSFDIIWPSMMKRGYPKSDQWEDRKRGYPKSDQCEERKRVYPKSDQWEYEEKGLSKIWPMRGGEKGLSKILIIFKNLQSSI